MAPPKILIVDDDADHRQGLNLRLRANHYETVLAADAAQAVSAAKKDRPDLVLLDLRLPGDDGFVVMEQFRASAELSVIPVIVITVMNSARDRALEAGAVAFFQKPVDNAELVAAIRRALGEVRLSITLNTKIVQR
jgi:two-component system cell cycle response regulator